MFKLYKRLRPKDWVLTAVIVCFTVLQVYCTMQVVDFISQIIEDIQYVDFHTHYNNLPSSIVETLTSLGLVTADGVNWDGVKLIFANDTSSLGQMMLTIADASTKDIWIDGAFILLCAFGLMACQIINEVLASYITAHFATNIRSELNDKIEYSSLADINNVSSASLITRATNDIQQVSMANLLMLRMVFAAPVTAIWAICKVQATSWELTLTTAVAIVLLIIGIGVIMGLTIPKFKIMQKQTDIINGLTQENLTGLRVVRAFNGESYQEKKFNKANVELTKTQLFTGRVMGLMSPLMIIVMNGLTLAIYWIGSLLANKGSADYATITSFTMLATQIVMSFMMLIMMFIFWPRASVAANRINEILDMENSIKDPETEKEFISEGTVEFKDVSFKYPDADEYVLEHISFKANKGETVAFIGSTGSGKSTLINLVNRLYDASEGEVLVDGVNVKDVKQKTLRSKIGFVPQKGQLFSGTILSNIGFGKDIDVEKAEHCASIACASEFIEKMDGKYLAPIAQGGTNVSGGQRQRLCIARAIAIDPEIFVFDDSFSALDFKTDKQVRQNLAKEEKGKTKLIVAQRIGTIMDADKIVVLQEGKMVGIGTHNELLNNCPVYKEIALSQLSKEELGLE